MVGWLRNWGFGFPHHKVGRVRLIEHSGAVICWQCTSRIDGVGKNWFLLAPCWTGLGEAPPGTAGAH